jgi:uncharacterized protein YceH (UPF0502 family)
MALSDIEIRILGCLLEKERTTPEQYPLTTNSLILACNQKSNREPVVEYIEHEVNTALQRLRDRGLVVAVRGENERAMKHKHKLRDAFHLDNKSFAILAVLMLRGHQTPGELRTRTDRYVSFSDLADVEVSLERLATYQPALAKNYGRGPGQSQDRWGHLLGGDEERQRPRARPAPQGSLSSSSEEASSPVSQTSELDALKLEVAELKVKVERLYQQLGISSSE